MKSILSEIYDSIVVHEQGQDKEYTEKLEKILEPIKAAKSESEYEEIKDLVYAAAYEGEKLGFSLGVKYAVRLMNEL